MLHARLAGKARRARLAGQAKVRNFEFEILNSEFSELQTLNFGSRLSRRFSRFTHHGLLARPVLAFLLALVTPVVVSAAVNTSTAGPAPGAEQKAAEPLAPVSIPIPEITKHAEEVTKLLRDFKALALPSPAIERIKTRLPEMSAQLGPKLQSTIETLKEEPPLIILERMTQFWQASGLEVTGSVEILTKRATQLELELGQLADLRASWRQTLADAKKSGTPGSVVQRVDDILADIEATRAELQAQRAATLVLQEQVAQEVARCQDGIGRAHV